MRLFALAYERLLDGLGPSRWWPADTPFEVMVGAILTQNTSWKNVEKAMDALRTQKLLDPRKLMKISQKELAPIIRSSGYYNQKADRLLVLASWFGSYGFSPKRVVSERRAGDLRRELLGLRGVGPETADSILCYALGLPYFVVDAYTIRWLDRYRSARGTHNYEELRGMVEREFSRKYASNELTRHYNEFHALLVRLGNGLCTKKNPRCTECPLKRGCEKNI